VENVVRKLITATVPEVDREDLFALLDGDVDRDDDGTLHANGNRITYDSQGGRTEYDDDGNAVATSVESELNPDLPAVPGGPGPVDAATGTPAKKKNTSRTTKSTGGRKTVQRKSTGKKGTTKSTGKKGTTKSTRSTTKKSTGRRR
jgi:hypothetical protein